MKKYLLEKFFLMMLFSIAFTNCSGNSNNEAIDRKANNEELIFVNYRDIRDLNPHLYAG